MKVIVTGATGYVGHNLALTLARRGYQVRVLARDARSAFIPNHPFVEVFEGDITKSKTIFHAVKGCEVVFHAAGLVKFRANRTADFYDINVRGTHHMLEAALRAGVKKFVFTSTAGVIGSSSGKEMNENDSRITGFDNDYECSKLLAENKVKEYADLGLFTVIVAPTKVFGPGIDVHKFNVNSVLKRFI